MNDKITYIRSEIKFDISEKKFNIALMYSLFVNILIPIIADKTALINTAPAAQSFDFLILSRFSFVTSSHRCSIAVLISSKPKTIAMQIMIAKNSASVIFAIIPRMIVKIANEI